jgi:DNA-binding winged helix-turn-helix (wHTH) protein/tetratricopeptide (TPR) repeat protein
MSLLPNDLYQFDEFELSRSRRTLLRNGQSVSLLPKTFEVLSCLVGNPGRVVAKDELLKTVWPESFVEENNLTQHISLLRKALGDRASYIVTIPGRGYQFAASVSTQVPNGHPQNGNGTAPYPGQPRQAAVEEAQPAPPAAAIPAPAPASLPRHTVARWVVFSLAFATIAVMAGFAVWKQWSHPPQLRKVLVADFSNSTGDATFDHTLKRALEIDLEQSPYIDLMSEREAMSTLDLMGRTEDTPITSGVALEICARSNRNVLLTGDIIPVGHEYLLTLEATDCASGKQLTAAKAEAGAKEKVLAALDKVADRVRRGLGETSQSMENYQVPIMDATTASLDALTSYSIGQSMDAQGKNETETLPFYQKAVELDPQFAMAYGAIGNEYYNLSEPKLAAQYYKKAFDLSGRVSAKEKLILQAHYYSEGLQNMEQGINTYRQWTETYPNDWVPWVDLANDYTQIGQYPPAIAAGQQALKIEPNRAINSSVLVRAYKRANRFVEAKSVGFDAVRRGKDSSGLHASLYELAVIDRDPNALTRETKWAANNNTGWYGWYFIFLRAEAAEAAGKQREADALFRSGWETAEHERLQEAADDLLIYQASVELSFGLPAAARATLGRLQNQDPDSPDLAIVRASLGDVSAAERYLSAHGADANPGTLEANVDLPRVRATLSMVRGKPLDAVAALEPTRPFELASYTIPSQRAEAWLKAGKPDLALPEYQKILSNQGIDPLSPLYALAHLGMARAFVQQKKFPESRAEYERFFARWKEADSDLPLLAQARTEYARLATPPLPAPK